MAKKDPIDQFAEDLMVLMKRYKPSGVVIMLGVPEKDKVRQGAFVAGDPQYLRELVSECCDKNPELHNIIDDIALEHVQVEDVHVQSMPFMRGRKVD